MNASLDTGYGDEGAFAPLHAAPAAVSPARPALHEADGKIKAGKLLSFATIGMPLAAVEVPLTTYLPPLYALAFGFDLATLGLVFLIARLFDAIIDPLVGALSDRTRTRWGRRKPWIFAGGLIFAAFAAPIFFPPQNFGPVAFSISLFFFFTGYTFIATPFAAWAGEVSAQYHERTRIVTYQMVAMSSALLLALVLPVLLDFAPAIIKAHPEWISGLNSIIAVPAQIADGSFFKEPRIKLAAMGLMTFVLLAPALLLGLRALPEPPLPKRSTQPLNLAATIKQVWQEKLLLRVLGSNFAIRLGQGIRAALFVFVVSYVMGKPQLAPALFLFQFIIGVTAAPIWLNIGRRIGKHRAAVAGELLQVAINVSLIFISAARFELLIALTVLQALTQGSGNLMLRAIVADVADKHRLETGEDRAGVFFSVFALSDKAAAAVAVGLALPLVAWFGFNPKIANTQDALQGLIWVFALGPALGHLASAWLIHGFPLDEAKHREIRAALDAKAAANLETA